jgi:hypothetical protein
VPARFPTRVCRGQVLAARARRAAAEVGKQKPVLRAPGVASDKHVAGRRCRSCDWPRRFPACPARRNPAPAAAAAPTSQPPAAFRSGPRVAAATPRPR